MLLAIACPQVPYCIDGADACPQEDVGGGPGYEDFLEAMAKLDHPEHDSMVEWHGDIFDRAAFEYEVSDPSPTHSKPPVEV